MVAVQEGIAATSGVLEAGPLRGRPCWGASLQGLRMAAWSTIGDTLRDAQGMMCARAPPPITGH